MLRNSLLLSALFLAVACAPTSGPYEDFGTDSSGRQYLLDVESIETVNTVDARSLRYAVVIIRIEGARTELSFMRNDCQAKRWRIEYGERKVLIQDGHVKVEERQLDSDTITTSDHPLAKISDRACENP